MAATGTQSASKNENVQFGGLTVLNSDANAVFAWPVNTGVAAAGSTLADATQIYPGITVVSGANGTVGVKLPPTPTPGTICLIKGTTSGVLKVWPDAAATINAISSNGALSMTTGLMPLLLFATSATQWYTLPLVAS
jgi:hypothetical protein